MDSTFMHQLQGLSNIISLSLVNHQTKTRMETEYGQNSCVQNIN